MAPRADRRSPSPTALTGMCVAGLAVSASILILLVPALVQPGAQVHPLAAVGLVVLSTGFAVGARRWRPRRPGSDHG